MHFLRVLILCLLLAGLCGCPGSDERDEALESAGHAYSIGHFSEAERIYQHYLQANPEGPRRWEAWSRLVEISINVLGDYEKAAGLLNSMYLEFGDDPERAWLLLSRLAQANENMGKLGDAVNIWRKTLSLPVLDDLQRGNVAMRMARLLRQQHEYAQAEEVLKACADQAQDPNVKADCLYLYAQTLEYMVRRAQAQTLDNDFAGLDVAAIQGRIKDLLQTIRNLKGVDEERKAVATFLLADLLESQGKRQHARELFASIRETYPNPMVIETRLKSLQ